MGVDHGRLHWILRLEYPDDYYDDLNLSTFKKGEFLMKTLLNILVCILLLFNGIGALYGGLSLMMHPDGSGLQLSLQLLEHTPFKSFFIPGIILFITNGLFSIFAFISLILRKKNYEWLLVAQGFILIGWISIQIVLIQTINFLHIILGLTGIGMVVSGYLLKKNWPHKKII